MRKRGDLQTRLKRFFLAKLYKYIEEDRSTEVHVTDVVYGCPLRAYLSKKYPMLLEARKDEASIITLSLGKKLHEIPIGEHSFEEYKIRSREDVEEIKDKVYEIIIATGLEKPFGFHELPVAYFPGESDKPLVVGRLDELIFLPGEGWILIDKKTTVNMPSSPYEHHIIQLKIYAYLLKQNYDIRPDYIGIVYIDHGSKKVEVFTEEYQDEDDLIEVLLGQAHDIRQALETGEEPDLNPGWWCKYCPFYTICLAKELGSEPGKGDEEDEN